MQCVTRGRNCSSSSFSLKKLLHLYAKGFMTKEFPIFIVDEVKNFAANIFFKLVELVTYWDPCIIN